MKTAKKIKERINSIKEGETFTYDQLAIDRNEYASATKAVERLLKKRIIKRLRPGIFYKPQKTRFGELIPNEEEILKPYLFENGKRIAYITGTFLYNKLGLTTQIPQVIKIASRKKEIKVNKPYLKIKPAKSYVDVTSNNYQYLEILDALKDFSKIPDLNKENGVKTLSEILKKLSEKEIDKLIKLSLKYPPRTRAFLGALLENLNVQKDLDILKESLNPLSEYAYGIKNILKTAENWNIK
jgi:hypothetical protein